MNQDNPILVTPRLMASKDSGRTNKTQS